jgi:hypothetical protein
MDELDSIYFAGGESLEVQIVDLDGSVAGGFRRAFEPPAVTRADVRAVTSRWADDESLRHVIPVLERSAPRRWPAVRQLLVDDERRIWIELGRRNTEPSEWAIFEQNGTYLGSVFPPETLRIRLVRNGRIYASENHPEEGPRVVVLGL